MKKLIAIFLILLSGGINAQKVKVENAKYKFISGEKHALKVNIFTDDIKDIRVTYLGTTINFQPIQS